MTPYMQGHPRIILCVGAVDEFCSTMYTLQSEMPTDIVSRIVRGKKMPSADRLFDEFAAAWQFPCYFGQNWDAFEECMSDFDWLPAKAYLVTVIDGSDVLRNQLDSLTTFLDVMHSVAEEWERSRGIVFRTVLQCADESIDTLRGALVVPFEMIRVTELKSFLNV